MNSFCVVCGSRDKETKKLLEIKNGIKFIVCRDCYGITR